MLFLNRENVNVSSLEVNYHDLKNYRPAIINKWTLYLEWTRAFWKCIGRLGFQLFLCETWNGQTSSMIKSRFHSQYSLVPAKDLLQHTHLQLSTHCLPWPHSRRNVPRTWWRRGRWWSRGGGFSGRTAAYEMPGSTPTAETVSESHLRRQELCKHASYGSCSYVNPKLRLYFANHRNNQS